MIVTGVLVSVAVTAAAAVRAGRFAGADTIFVAVSPTDTIVTPGDEFDLHLRVTQPGRSFNAYDAIIAYDPAALTFVPRPASVQEGSSMRDACNNTFHVFHAAGDSLAINHSLLCQGLSLQGPALLYNLRFRASTTAQATLVSVRSTEFYNAGLFARPVVITNATAQIGMSVDVRAPLQPDALRLAAAPNPFNPMTTFHIRTGVAGAQSLVVRDASGRTIRWLQRGIFAAGERQTTWDGRDADGVRVASGVYVVTLESAGRRVSQRLVLLK
jgi:hypothetical protein